MISLKKVRELVAGKDTFNVDMTLNNGDIITIVTEADEPQVGDPVKRKTDNGEEVDEPLEDGQHTTQDGKTLVVQGGIITEIKEENDEKNDEPAPTSEEFQKAVDEAVAKAVAKANEQFSKDFETLSKAILLQNQRIERLSKSVKSNFQSNDPASDPNGFAGASKSISIEELRARQKSYKS